MIYCTRTTVGFGDLALRDLTTNPQQDKWVRVQQHKVLVTLQYLGDPGTTSAWARFAACPGLFPERVHGAENRVSNVHQPWAVGRGRSCQRQRPVSLRTTFQGPNA